MRCWVAASTTSRRPKVIPLRGKARHPLVALFMHERIRRHQGPAAKDHEFRLHHPADPPAMWGFINGG